MQGWALTLAYCSPLTYLVDLFNAAMIGTSVFSPFVDGGVLIVVCAGFILAARVIQKRKYDEGDVKISWPQFLYTLPHKHWDDTGMTAIPKKIYH
jgi:hypothetical protein